MDLEIQCPYRQGATCHVVYRLLQEFTPATPLEECVITDKACQVCQASGVDPTTPNHVTGSICVSTVSRLKSPALRLVLNRARPHLNKQPPADTRCVLRGAQTRQIPCKPCQSRDGKSGTADVYSCPIHQQCTLLNTGHTPKIQACATCEDRKPEYTPAPRAPKPPEQVLAIIHQQRSGR